MDKTQILTLVLVVLALVSAVQAYQLTTIKSKIENNELSSTPRVKSTGDVSVPNNLQDLPQMVGGC